MCLLLSLTYLSNSNELQNGKTRLYSKIFYICILIETIDYESKHHNRLHLSRKSVVRSTVSLYSLLQNIFEDFDTDGSGLLSRAELNNAFKNSGT